MYLSPVKRLLFLLCCWTAGSVSAQVPSFGSSKQIDLLTWNLCWYGDDENGPSNHALQRASIGEVVRNTRMDVFFFQEITDTADFTSLLKESGNFRHVYAQYWQDQKIGWAWDASVWTYLSDSVLFQQSPADFANGRLPLMVTLISKNSEDTLLLVGIHLKAHTGSNSQKLAAYKNRQASINHLKNWQNNHADRKVIIAGDWNDDIDKSIYNDSVSSILGLYDEGTFLMEKQSLAGAGSWYYGNAMIDHVWVNDKMNAQNLPPSSQMLPLDWYFSDYPNTVSDHFPVYVAFSKQVKLPNGLEAPKVHTVWPNPSLGTFYLSEVSEQAELVLYDMRGENVPFSLEEEGSWKRISGLKAGVYSLLIQEHEQVSVYRLVVTP